MKYCPYCGAELTVGAASFCAECGKTLPGEAQAKPEEKQSTSRKKKPRDKKQNPAPSNETEAKKDEWYDGYYDDVLPTDHGRLKEGPDRDLIRKIAAVTGVMLLIITLCVVAMYVL